MSDDRTKAAAARAADLACEVIRLAKSISDQQTAAHLGGLALRYRDAARAAHLASLESASPDEVARAARTAELCARLAQNVRDAARAARAAQPLN